MGSPETHNPSKTSLNHRMSAALERIERMTETMGGHDDSHVEPKTVEEAVQRLKRKVTGKTG